VSSAAACPHYEYCTDPDAPVVHYWVDLQSVHGLRCYGNITRTRNVSEYMLVFAVCLVKACNAERVDSVDVRSENDPGVQRGFGLSPKISLFI